MSKSANHLSAIGRNGRRPETAGKGKGVVLYEPPAPFFSSFREEAAIPFYPAHVTKTGKRITFRVAGKRGEERDLYHLFSDSESSALGGKDAISSFLMSLTTIYSGKKIVSIHFLSNESCVYSEYLRQTRRKRERERRQPVR